MVCAVIVEVLVLLIFRGYKRDAACVLAGTLYMPMTLPFLYLWYNVIYSINPAEDGKAVQAFVGADPWVAIGISVAVLVLCFVGAIVGMIISRELKKQEYSKNEFLFVPTKDISAYRALCRCGSTRVRADRRKDGHSLVFSFGGTLLVSYIRIL